MTERITPAEVQGWARWAESKPYLKVAEFLNRLAEQMESDRIRFEDIHAAWGERYFAAELERDALAAKVREYEERLKGRVVARPQFERIHLRNPDHQVTRAKLHVWADGEDDDSATDALQTAIDKEEANHGNDHG
jgi:hypothetical protein